MSIARTVAAPLRFVLLSSALALSVHTASAALLLPGFAETLVTTGLSAPTRMDFAPDGRLFVLEQTGNVRLVQNGVLQASPFASLTVDARGERGLLGIAFDPNFAQNKYVYLYHTVPGAAGSASHNRITRLTASGNQALAGSETIIADLEPLSGATNHNGGEIRFGADGKLYVGVGENANPNNSQVLTNRLGKILRLNSDGSIPTDNPFFTTATGNNRAIWAYGLRNPYSFAFQPGTGVLNINDVGQNEFEEINRGTAGANYGWFGGNSDGPANDPRFTDPIFSYRHGAGTEAGFSIVGATFYNPVRNNFPPAYRGDYFYADFVNGWIHSLDATTNVSTLFASGINTPIDLKVGADGDLYYLSRNSGSVTRIQSTIAAAAPEPTALMLFLTGIGVLINRRRKGNRSPIAR